jgi:alpha-methylacyl-CoA racemase
MSRLNTFLSGIRVIDLSRHLPGPFATLLLADMGAEVIKIEPPGGDDLRTMGPRGPRAHSVYFDAVNAGKTTRRMNLKDPDARAALLRLVETADVLVESFRPDVMARLELDYETVKQCNPGLVYCSLSGFGATGPLSHKPGHDLNYVSLAGALSRSAAGEPMLPESLLADNAGALFASLAIVGALFGRTRDQRGCHLDLALADAVLPLRLFQVAALGMSVPPPAYGVGQLNGGAAYYQIYATSDGRHVSLAAIEHRFWEAFCNAAERREWISRHEDALPQTVLTREVADMFRTMSLTECERRFDRVDCCFSTVLDLRSAMDSEHQRSRGLVQHGSDGVVHALLPVLVDGEPPLPRPSLRTE